MGLMLWNHKGVRREQTERGDYRTGKTGRRIWERGGFGGTALEDEEGIRIEMEK